MSTQNLPDQAAHEQLRLLGSDPANWVTPNPAVDHNVVVVGGGQTGVTIAFALRRAGIGNVSVIDAAEDESRAGVWLTSARMRTLRTPKNRSGPELGIPALGFQAWYEALHGPEAFAAIGRIARTDWAQYLGWYRRQVGIEVRYGTGLIDIDRADGNFALTLLVGGCERVETARKVVFANGIEGSGGPNIPAIFRDLPRRLWAHTGDAINFDALRGRRIGVLGAATSALDGAAVALESGACEVHVFSYRSDLVIQPTREHPQNPGLLENFHLQADDVRWKTRWAASSKGSSSPWDTVGRVTKCENFALHLTPPGRNCGPRATR
ncbi:FAD-dependent oxidoreductase [Nocardia sp. NPDC056952]|uniref:FAD-dependent oxidoreductase n=1 Tax=Nocardia sp. NPDC056952 TaxID=3345979 RepID=UPI00363975F2